MFHLGNGQGVSHIIMIIIINNNKNNKYLLNECYFSPSNCKNIEAKVVKLRGEE